MTTRRSIVILALVPLALTAVSCTSDPGDDRASIDASSYYRHYRSGSSGSMSSGVAQAAGDAVGTGTPVGPGEPGLLDDNTFVDAGTSGFVDTRSDPLSTFALDVDTGSYSIARTLLTQGVRPPATSIRAEEWVNAFDYAYPAPADTDLGLVVDQATAPSTTDGTQLVSVGVKAREVAEADRPPVAVTLVVDTSGSMDIRERLGLVQSSLALLAKHLRPTDTVAVVTYQSDARPVLEPTPVSDTATILDAIDRLRPGGSTNLEAGLRLGYEQARAAYRDDAVNVVVLASDGVANVGTTRPDSLAKTIREAGDEGIHLVTVGYGMGNYNDDLMEQLADQGDGFYSYVDTFEEAERLFRDELTATLTTVAEDAKIQVTFDPAVVSSYRLVGYDNRALDDRDFDKAAVDAGELGAGHAATALYEVRLSEPLEAGTRIGTATLRWRSPESGAEQELSGSLASAADGPPSGALMLAATVADTAQLLKGAEPFAGRAVTMGDLRERAEALAADGVDGADELSRLIGQAMAAR